MQSNIAIQLQDLSKVYGKGSKRVQALNQINLNVESKQIFGFLGPNGAGKSTTIRLTMDLIRPTHGAAYVYGKEVRKQHAVLRKVGAIVEQASFYPFLTGQRNLEVLADVGHHDPNCISQLLDQVGLTRHAEKRVSTYSTGMRQRLGLAAALLGDPDLLILDEPTAGLDPAGMHEVRSFLRHLVEEKEKTVFLSSHLLAEVEHICHRVAIIHKGEIIREGKVSDLLLGQTHVRIQVSSCETAIRVLRDDWDVFCGEYDKNEASAYGSWISINATEDKTPEIVRRLVTAGVDIFHVAAQRKSLEAYFLEATREKNPNA
jgi:ABC-2 type transport system ATP-binding protein